MNDNLVALKEAVKKAEQEYHSAVEDYMREILQEIGFDGKDVNVLLPSKDSGLKGVLRVRGNLFDGKPEIVFYEYTKSGTLSNDALHDGCHITLYDCEQCTKEAIINCLQMCYSSAATEEVTTDA